MKPYRKTDSYTLYLDDAWAVLDSLAENSIDAIVTDPPYEIGFMNKGWDNTGVAFDKQTWQKALRVLKPGGHLLAFNHSRTFHRMAVAIEDAGFEIRDTIMWLYGSGFPKSHDISKAIDKNNGQLGRILTFTQWFRNTKLTIKQVTDVLVKNKLISKNGTMAAHYFANSIAGQPAIPTLKIWNAIKPLLNNVPHWVDELVQRIEAERIVIGKKENAMSGWNMDGTTKFVDRDITTAATDAAKQWEGWGTALKPAYEPILLARKPIPTTVADNVLQYGTGAINIDGCRVGTTTLDNYDLTQRSISKASGVKNDSTFLDAIHDSDAKHGVISEGRFPANVIHDGSEEVVQGFPETTSGTLSPHHNIGNNAIDVFSVNKYKEHTLKDYGGDSGSASRFFYTAKTSKKDRDDGLDIEARYTSAAEFRPNHMAKALEGDSGNPYGRWQPKRNIHPTVKPTDLMQYLIRLIAAPNATILDIFMGSGSTGKAAMIENAERDSNYHFIGIDRTAEYLPIAEARIEFGLNYITEKPKADGVVHKEQIDIFTLL